MPETPVTRKRSPVVVTRENAKLLDCGKLHAGAFHQTGSRDITITLVPGTITQLGTFVPGPARTVPNQALALDTLIPVQFEHASIQVEYTYSTMLPHEKLTRADFVMELLDVFERQRERIVSWNPAKGQLLEEIMAAVSAVYGYNELVPDIDAFKELFTIEPLEKIEADEMRALDTSKEEGYGHGI